MLDVAGTLKTTQSCLLGAVTWWGATLIQQLNLL